MNATEGWLSEFDTPTSDETEWTAANVQEALPGLITPMTWSFVQPLLEDGFARPARRMGTYVAPRDPFIALFYSRAYLNATALREGAKRSPGGSPEAIDEQYLGRQRDPNVPAWKPSPREVLGWLMVLPRMVWLMARTGKEIEAAERLVRDLGQKDGALDLQKMSLNELVDQIEGGFDVGREVAGAHIGASAGASATFEALGQLTRNWLDDETGSLQATLVSGLANVESARAPRALWDLSRYAVQSPEVSAALEASDARQALQLLRRSDSQASRNFVRAYDAFVERFGHRSVLEGELSAPNWEEDTATVFAMLRNLRDTGADASPYLIQARQRILREKETEAALEKLNAPRRLLFRRVLSLAQTHVANRERTKSLLVKGTQRARRLLREIGARLVAAGRIDRPDEVFFLTLDDLRSGESAGTPDLRALVSRRKAEMDRNRHVVLPESFVGRPRPLEVRPPSGEAVVGAVSAVPTVLKGIPVSPGRVSGKARVILDPRLDGAIAEGEILVAPVTDAGWTPLFLTAAAIVVDIGGPLSHGATVARELGLPAVVNVKNGTTVIQSGQLITVDGREGTVTVDADPSAGP
jgi:phosphohistidine swiveling domain-containing protein